MSLFGKKKKTSIDRTQTEAWTVDDLRETQIPGRNLKRRGKPMCPLRRRAPSCTFHSPLDTPMSNWINPWLRHMIYHDLKCLNRGKFKRSCFAQILLLTLPQTFLSIFGESNICWVSGLGLLGSTDREAQVHALSAHLKKASLFLQTEVRGTPSDAKTGFYCHLVGP